MTYINNTIMLIEDEIAGNMSNEHSSKIQDKKIWKSLRTHILSRREKNKQGTFIICIICLLYKKLQLPNLVPFT